MFYVFFEFCFPLKSRHHVPLLLIGERLQRIRQVPVVCSLFSGFVSNQMLGTMLTAVYQSLKKCVFISPHFCWYHKVFMRKSTRKNYPAPGNGDIIKLTVTIVHRLCCWSRKHFYVCSKAHSWIIQTTTMILSITQPLGFLGSNRSDLTIIPLISEYKAIGQVSPSDW